MIHSILTGIALYCDSHPAKTPAFHEETTQPAVTNRKCIVHSTDRITVTLSRGSALVDLLWWICSGQLRSRWAAVAVVCYAKLPSDATIVPE